MAELISSANANLWDQLAAEDSQLIYLLHLTHVQLTGNILLELKRRTRRASGTWGPPRAFSISRSKLDNIHDPVDRELLSTLLGARSTNSWEIDLGVSEFVLPRHHAQSLVRRLCATGRMYGCYDHEVAEPALQWDDDGVWKFELRISMEANRARLEGHLVRGAEVLRLDELDLATDTGLVFIAASIAAVDFGESFDVASQLGAAGPVEVPIDDVPKLIEVVQRLPGHAPLRLPEPWHCEPAAPPQPCLELTAAQGRGARTGAPTLVRLQRRPDRRL